MTRASALTLSLILLGAASAQANHLTVSTGAHHKPSSSYHYVGYQAAYTFENSDAFKALELGLLHPYSGYGYSQNLIYSSFTWNWTQKGSSILSPFGGIGPGFYLERVNSENGFVPSLVLQAGVRLGGKNLGLSLKASTYAGVFEWMHPVRKTVWPMTSFTVGVYAGF